MGRDSVGPQQLSPRGETTPTTSDFEKLLRSRTRDYSASDHGTAHTVDRLMFIPDDDVQVETKPGRFAVANVSSDPSSASTSIPRRGGEPAAPSTDSSKLFTTDPADLSHEVDSKLGDAGPDGVPLNIVKQSLSFFRHREMLVTNRYSQYQRADRVNEKVPSYTYEVDRVEVVPEGQVRDDAGDTTKDDSPANDVDLNPTEMKVRSDAMAGVLPVSGEEEHANPLFRLFDLATSGTEYAWEGGTERNLCGRVPVLPYDEDRGFPVLVELKNAQLDALSLLSAVDISTPVFFLLDLVDIRRGERVAETFHFEVNSTKAIKILGKNIDLSVVDHIPPPAAAPEEDISERYWHRGFYQFPYVSKYLFWVLRVSTVLSGEEDEAADVFLKPEKYSKDPKKYMSKINENTTRLAAFHQRIAWSYAPVYKAAALTSNMANFTSVNGRLAVDPNNEMQFSELFRYRSNAMGMNSIVDAIRELERDTSSKRPKTVPGSVALSVRALEQDTYTRKYFPDGSAMYRVEPLFTSYKHTIAAREIRTFPLASSPSPHLRPENVMYIYPTSVNFTTKAGNSSSRNIVCEVRVCPDDRRIDGGQALPVIYPQYQRSKLAFGAKAEQSDFVCAANTQVLYHQKHPEFDDEFKIRLPTVLNRDVHLLFTFYHVSVQFKAGKSLRTVVGHAVLPLMSSEGILANGEYSLPVALSLPTAHYLSASVPSTSTQAHFVDGGKNVFNVKIQPFSSLYPLDPHLVRYFALQPFAARDRFDDVYGENDLQSTISNKYLRSSLTLGPRVVQSVYDLQHVDESVLMKFLPVILNSLFDIISHQSNRDLCRTVFRVLVLLLSRVDNVWKSYAAAEQQKVQRKVQGEGALTPPDHRYSMFVKDTRFEAERNRRATVGGVGAGGKGTVQLIVPGANDTPDSAERSSDSLADADAGLDGAAASVQPDRKPRVSFSSGSVGVTTSDPDPTGDMTPPPGNFQRPFVVPSSSKGDVRTEPLVQYLSFIFANVMRQRGPDDKGPYRPVFEAVIEHWIDCLCRTDADVDRRSVYFGESDTSPQPNDDWAEKQAARPATVAGDRNTVRMRQSTWSRSGSVIHNQESASGVVSDADSKKHVSIAEASTLGRTEQFTAFFDTIAIRNIRDCSLQYSWFLYELIRKSVILWEKSGGPGSGAVKPESLRELDRLLDKIMEATIFNGQNHTIVGKMLNRSLGLFLRDGFSFLDKGFILQQITKYLRALNSSMTDSVGQGLSASNSAAEISDSESSSIDDTDDAVHVNVSLGLSASQLAENNKRASVPDPKLLSPSSVSAGLRTPSPEKRKSAVSPETGLSPSFQSLNELKLQFLAIISDYEHFVPLCIPTEWSLTSAAPPLLSQTPILASYYKAVADALPVNTSTASLDVGEMSNTAVPSIITLLQERGLGGIFIQELAQCYLIADAELRSLAISSTVNLLRKLEYDSRYLASEQSEMIAGIFFPLLLLIIDQFNDIEAIQTKNRRNLDREVQRLELQIVEMQALVTAQQEREDTEDGIAPATEPSSKRLTTTDGGRPPLPSMSSTQRVDMHLSQLGGKDKRKRRQNQTLDQLNAVLGSLISRQKKKRAELRREKRRLWQERRDLFMCILFIMRNLKRSLIRDWLNREGPRRVKMFVHLLRYAVVLFEYPGREDIIREEESLLGRTTSKEADPRSAIEKKYSRLASGSLTSSNASLRRSEVSYNLKSRHATAIDLKKQYRHTLAALSTGSSSGIPREGSLGLQFVDDETDDADPGRVCAGDKPLYEGALCTQVTISVLRMIRDLLLDQQEHLLSSEAISTGIWPEILSLLQSMLFRHQSDEAYSAIYRFLREYIYLYRALIYGATGKPTTKSVQKSFDDSTAEQQHVQDELRFTEILCRGVLRHCAFQSPTVRSEAAYTLYFLMRTNFATIHNFYRVKVQTTMALSKQVNEITRGEYLEQSLDSVFRHAIADVSSWKEEPERPEEKRSPAKLWKDALSFLSHAGGELLKGSKSDLTDGKQKQHKRTKSKHEDTITPQRFISEVKELTRRLRTVLMDTLRVNQIMNTRVENETIADLYWRIAKSYDHTPELRVSWLHNTAKYHKSVGRWSEGAQCLTHVVALVSEYLKLHGMIPPPVEPYIRRLVWVSPSLANERFEELHNLVKEGEEDLGEQSSVFSLDGLVKELQRTIKYLHNAEQYEFENELYKVLIAIHETNYNYAELSLCYSHLHKIYRQVVEKNSKLGRTQGAYYRVGFYGHLFTDEVDHIRDGDEFIYREKKFTRIMEVRERIEALYSAKFTPEKLHIIMDSKAVKRSDLNPDHVYIQITTVEPYYNQSVHRKLESITAGLDADAADNHVRFLRQYPRQSHFEHNVHLRHFIFDTPFTKSGKAHADRVVDQFTRKTVLTVERSFPDMVSKQRVTSRREVELTPIEAAMEIIHVRNENLAVELSREPIDVNSLQILLQGSVRIQVNAGPAEIVRSFLGNRSAFDPDHIRQLEDITRRFLDLCYQALLKNEQVISPEHMEFHKELEKGYFDTKKMFEPYLNG